MRLNPLIIGVLLVMFIVSLIFPIVKVALALCWIVYLTFKVIVDKMVFFTPLVAGGTMNLLPTLANNFRMPITPEPYFPLDPTHSAITPSTHLKFLCDIYPIGHWGMFSAGDALILIIWPLTMLGTMLYSKYWERRGYEIS